MAFGRKKQVPAITGPDLLMLSAKQAVETGDVPEAYAAPFIDMLFTCFDASLSASDEMRHISKRPLEPHEAAAVVAIGNGIQMARSHGDDETVLETIQVGLSLLVKLGEYVEAREAQE